MLQSKWLKTKIRITAKAALEWEERNFLVGRGLTGTFAVAVSGGSETKTAKSTLKSRFTGVVISVIFFQTLAKH